MEKSFLWEMSLDVIPDECDLWYSICFNLLTVTNIQSIQKR